ncbi:MAG: AAA family ATPase [Gemmatimonadaceae bacterium]
MVRLSDVQPEKVEWLWPDRIPFGKVTVLEGDPGLGKSTLALAIAAAVSTGHPLPGGRSDEPADVLVLTFEDGLADTIRPRVDAAGGDPRRITAIRGVWDPDIETNDLVSFPKDIALVRDLAEQTGARLFIVDPLGASLTIDSYKDADIRRALAPLAKLAEDLGIAVLVIRHLTKNGSGRAITAGGGSIGIAGAARCVLGAYKHPEDESRRILAVVKNNLAPTAASLEYAIEADGKGSSRIGWMGASSFAADDLVAARLDVEESLTRDKVDETAALLRGWLSDDRGLPSPKGLPRGDCVQLARKAGIAERTLDRAAKKLGVTRDRAGVGKDHHSVWKLATATTSATSSTYGGNGASGASPIPEANSSGESPTRATVGPSDSTPATSATSVNSRGLGESEADVIIDPDGGQRFTQEAIERFREERRRAFSGAGAADDIDDGESV